MYVAFQSISVTDLCGVVGTAIKGVTTIGFDATELSTAISVIIPPESQAVGGDMFITTQPWWTYSAINYPERCVSSNLVSIANDNNGS